MGVQVRVEIVHASDYRELVEGSSHETSKTCLVEGKLIYDLLTVGCTVANDQIGLSAAQGVEHAGDGFGHGDVGL